MSLSDELKLAIANYISDCSKAIGSKFHLKETDILEEFRGADRLFSDELKGFERVMSEYLQTVRTRLGKRFGCDVAILQSLMTEDKIETNLDITTLSRYSLTQLKNVCREKKLKLTGKKDELILRIMGIQQNSSTGTIDSIVPSTKNEHSSIKKSVPKLSSINTHLPVFAKIKKEKIVISKNSFGNYVHSPTSLVYSKELRKIIGVQEPDGTVSSLTDTSIQLCKQWKFEYVLPKNLDRYGDLNDVRITELDDEEDDEEDEDDDTSVSDDE